MPIYDFHCPKCQHTFEELSSPHEVAPCPQCGNVETERRVSAPSPVLNNPFPYKVGPVHPIAKRMAAGGGGGCPHSGGCGGGTGGGGGGKG